MLKVLIADDHEIVRHGIRDIIDQHGSWEVSGEAGDGRAAVDMARAVQPDVVVMDISLPNLNGLTATRLIRQSLPQTEVLFFTMHDDSETVTGALAAGARGYLLKTEGDVQLESAITAVGGSRPYFSASITQLLLDSAIFDRRKSRLESFTTRELEVAQLIAEGASNKTIARQLNISVKTVESHRAAALRKAEVHTAAEFVRFALKHHLIRA